MAHYQTMKTKENLSREMRSDHYAIWIKINLLMEDNGKQQ